MTLIQPIRADFHPPVAHQQRMSTSWKLSAPPLVARPSFQEGETAMLFADNALEKIRSG
jgi:hypothetical protein